jgi:outer membrane immunogenic protein
VDLEDWMISITTSMHRVGATVAVGLFALGAVAGTAKAADLYAPPRQAAYPTTELERWTGFYLGAALGYGRGKTELTNPFASADLSGSGWLGSVYAGYNWRFGPLVAGLEADLGTGGYNSSTFVDGARFETSLGALASVRGRVGLLATENFMFYGTGGFAMARARLGVEGGGSANETLKGYQLGFGGEYKFNPNWSLKLEYIYTDLKETTRAFGGTQNRFDPDFHTVRAGVSFKF